MGQAVGSFEELHVYQKAFRMQQAVFECSTTFLPEERFALTDRGRRAPPSVGAGLAEAWAKRRYKAHVVSKRSDADSELGETRHWLHTAKACPSLGAEEHDPLLSASSEIGAMLGTMRHGLAPWLLRPIA